MSTIIRRETLQSYEFFTTNQLHSTDILRVTEIILMFLLLVSARMSTCRSEPLSFPSCNDVYEVVAKTLTAQRKVAATTLMSDGFSFSGKHSRYNTNLLSLSNKNILGFQHIISTLLFTQFLVPLLR